MTRLALVLALAFAAVPAAAVAQAPAKAPAAPAAKAAAAKPAAPAAKPAAEAAPKPPPGFTRVSGSAKAQPEVHAIPLVVAAYLFIWALTILYLVFVWVKQRRIEAELTALKRRLEQAVGD